MPLSRGLRLLWSKLAPYRFCLLLAGLAALVYLGLRAHEEMDTNLPGIQKEMQTRLLQEVGRMQNVRNQEAFKNLLDLEARDFTSSHNVGSETHIIEGLKRQNLTTYIYRRGILRFWSSNQVAPEHPDSFATGISCRLFRNGIYLARREVQGSREILFLSLVKRQFDFENTFLVNGFSSWFWRGHGADISTRPIPGSLAIFGLDGRKMLFVSLSKGHGLPADSFEFVCACSLLGLFYLLLYLLCRQFIKIKMRVMPVLFGILVPVALRAGMIDHHLPMELYRSRFFSPLVYSSNPIFYSLGDFTLNVVLCLWLLYLCRSLLEGFEFKVQSKLLSWLLAVLAASLQLVSYYLFERLFMGLVENSSIPHDLTNILSVNAFTITAFSLLSMSWLCMYVLTAILNRLSGHDGISNRLQVIFAVCVCLLVAGIQAGLGQPFYFSLLCGAIAILMLRQEKPRQVVDLFVIVMLISLVSALRLLDYGSTKENSARLAFAEKLEKSNDPVSEYLLKDNERHISSDGPLTALLAVKNESQKLRLFRQASQRLSKVYFGRNFSNYEFQTFLYDRNEQLVSGPDVYSLRVFVSAAASPQIRKVSEYFYQLQTSLPDYIGIIPLVSGGLRQGTLVLRISARYLGENSSFPDLLMDGKTSLEHRQENYSYAYYKNQSLLDKFGRYPYSITDEEMTRGRRRLPIQYIEEMGYSHLLYSPSAANVIVVSQPAVSFFKKVAVCSYLLCFNLIFLGLLALMLEGRKIIALAGSLKNLIGLLRRQRFLYKTRIRLSLITGVFFSLVIVGWVTLVYIQNQYAGQQTDLVSERINTLRKAFENEMPVDSISKASERYNLAFLSLASRQGSDLNFYDTNGDLLYTTLPKLFDRGLVSAKMEPGAFYEMFVSGRTELVGRESIGRLSFLSVYAPVRNSANQVAGYVNLPFFADQEVVDQKLSSFVSALINVYVLIFLLIGILAFVLASSITTPLALIQESLRHIKIGNLNRPLQWKRNDEIGDLIAAYNQMVLALEDSAEKLARSERETAWREMAKQVAHEIKNPLTPLKLGIQHLEQSWKNKDARFDEKFKKFSQTFIEQIDSLSAIASEFSNFAKMPVSQPERLDLADLAELSANLFRESESMAVSLSVQEGLVPQIRADRDQILRVFNNLLKNAEQSIPAGRLGLATIQISSHASWIILEITDNGCGIPDEIRPRIFSPSFTTKSSGTGLGLAFVKNVVESTGGTIKFESSAAGTCFELSFPAAELQS